MHYQAWPISPFNKTNIWYIFWRISAVDIWHPKVVLALQGKKRLFNRSTLAKFVITNIDANTCSHPGVLNIACIMRNDIMFICIHTRQNVRPFSFIDVTNVQLSACSSLFQPSPIESPARCSRTALYFLKILFVRF